MPVAPASRQHRIWLDNAARRVMGHGTQLAATGARLDTGNFLHRFREWTASTPDIRAAVLVGSHARGVAGPDSDLDLVMLVRTPAIYLRDSSWAERFGTILRHQIEPY